MTKHEKQLKSMERMARAYLGLTDNDLFNNFWNKGLDEIEAELSRCGNSNDAKRHIQSYCGFIKVWYNTSSQCYCVSFNGIFLFSFSKIRGWSGFKVNNMYNYGKGKWFVKKIIDNLKHELRYKERYNRLSEYSVSRDKPKTAFVYRVEYNCELKRYVSEIIGTNGVMIYKKVKEDIKYYEQRKQHNIEDLQKNIEETIKKLNDLVFEKNNYDITHYEASEIERLNGEINKLLGREVA